jgi:hypothetical protein
MSGGLQVFYFEISEAVRPKGSAVAALGWLWTVEGTFASLRCCTWWIYFRALLTKICFSFNHNLHWNWLLSMLEVAALLKAADRVPTEKEDEEALESNLDTNK